MLKLLECYPKTRPSNYQVQGIESNLEGSEEPTYSLTEEQWAKAKRMEDPNYDWYAYQQCVSKALFDHPDFAHRQHDEAIQAEWAEILSELEPFNPRGV